ncbi:hypothetical protein FRC01_006658, partial [Tulasnella sp. 417]
MHVALSEDGRRTTHSRRGPWPQRFPALTPVSNLIKEWVATPIGIYAQPLIRVFHPGGDDSAKPTEAQERQEQTVNAQTASWLLEVTSSLEDQTVAQNICCIDPTVCDLLSLHPRIGDRLLSLTVEAIHIYQNQPSKRSSSIAEQFGAAFYHIMLRYPRNHELWNQLGQRLPVGSFLAPRSAILLELADVLRGTKLKHARHKQSYSFRKVILHNTIVNFHDRWALEGRTTLMSSYDDAILSLLALHISLRIGKHADSMEIRIGEKLRNLAIRAYMGADLERNIADALPAVVSFIFYEGSDQIDGKWNAALICVAFLERIKLSIDRAALSPLLRETLSSFVRLSTVALGAFRALERTQPRGAYDTTTMESIYNTIQYAVIAAEQNPKSVDYYYLDDYLLESLEWAGIYGVPNLRSELEKYPRIVTWIASRLKPSPESKRDRWIAIIHANLTGLVHKRNLSVWEDAELGTHAVAYLRKVTSHPYLTRAVDIIRLLISLSVDCSTELLAAEIVNVVAEVSEAIIGWPRRAQYSRPNMYMELLDLLLKVWGATLHSWSVRSIRWPTDSTIRALSILMPHVFEAISQDVADGKVVGNTLEALPLLVDYLRKRKPEAAFMARGLDVSIN